ncbi:hypothetical protein M413DRAFT_113784 [Hebeloma cylindrosporum]|uniref:Uncharacterized protein n=1 Tax=Hebeloma cylindrosporum TaxID=76867 RepID=A0A0C3D0P1_HEBCY|nr:hypothetical protein M413DRAFT_113784 [Hebeloma cylindrosporum h7]
MAKSQDQVKNSGVIVWAEKAWKKKRYEFISVENQPGNRTKALVDVVPGSCGSSKHPCTFLLCWKFTPEWEEDERSLFLAEITVGPALNNKGVIVAERKIYVLIKRDAKGEQYTSAFPESDFLSKRIILDVYGTEDDDLILSAKLAIHRLRPRIDERKAEPLLMEANERCYAISADVLNALLAEGDQSPITFEFEFYRRKRASTTTVAGATSKKRKRPTKRVAEEEDSDSDPQYNPRPSRRRGSSVVGVSVSLFVRSCWVMDISAVGLQI